MTDFSDIQELSVMIKAIMTEFKTELENKLKEDLNKKKINRTGQTLNTLSVSVSEGIISNLLLSFQSHARILEVRNRSTQNASIDALASWVKEVGINNFKLKGVKNFENIKNPENRIAFAIATKKRRLGKAKNRPWYNKHIYKMVFGADGLVDTMLYNMTETMINELTALNNGNT